MLDPRPATSGWRIRSPPFPPSTACEIGERSWFANCIWDALGICALLDRDGTVETECEDCGESQSLAVRNGKVEGEGVAHFLVPAADFWDDIGFT